MNRLLLLSLSLAGVAAVLSPSAVHAQSHADTILVGGKVWTAEGEKAAVMPASESDSSRRLFMSRA